MLGGGCSAPGSSPTPAPPGVPARPADAEPLIVRHVYDGDTFQAQARRPGRHVTTTGKIRVRLIGIDAPELRPQPECHAREATRRLTALAAPGSGVWVAPDRDSWDRYGRRLFLVWTSDGRLINYELVADGSAEAIRVPPNVTYWPLLSETAEAAAASGRGRWACSR